MSEMNENEEWLCPECGEREQLMRATVTDRQTGVTRVKFQCAKCGYTRIEEVDGHE